MENERTDPQLAGAGDAGQNKTLERMTTQPVERLILTMAGPSIVIMLISALYNMADTFFVGRLGPSATAAVGVVLPLMNIIQAVGFFFGHGSGTYISRQLGAQKVESAVKMAATGVFSSGLAGVLIMLAGLVFIRPLTGLLGATPTIMPHAVGYMRFILIGAPWMTASLTINTLLRFQGSSFYGMIGMVSGAALNVALDPLFIFVFNMGVGGAALATILSQFLGFCLLLAGCWRGGNIRIRPREFSPSFATYREVLRGGAPALLRQVFLSVSTICVNQMAGAFGDAAIAATSIVQRVVMFASSALMGFGQGFQPMCGFNYGAGRYDRVKKGFFFCVRVTMLTLLALAIAGFVLAPQVVALFCDGNAEVVGIGRLSLRLLCLVLPLQSWTVLSSMLLQTIGRGAQASLLAVARQGLFLIPLLLVLTPFLGMLGIQLCQPISDFAGFAVAVPLTVSALRHMSRVL